MPWDKSSGVTLKTPVAESEKDYLRQSGRVALLTKKIIVNPDTEIKNYYGCSTCRICGKMNGSAEYILRGKFVIPSGYLHYLEDHMVEMDPVLADYLERNIAPKEQTTVGYWKPVEDPKLNIDTRYQEYFSREYQ